MRIFDIENGRTKVKLVPFKFAQFKASIHVGKDCYLAGGVSLGRKNINDFWKIGPIGLFAQLEKMLRAKQQFGIAHSRRSTELTTVGGFKAP